jgi:hypothetical protein
VVAGPRLNRVEGVVHIGRDGCSLGLRKRARVVLGHLVVDIAGKGWDGLLAIESLVGLTRDTLTGGAVARGAILPVDGGTLTWAEDGLRPAAGSEQGGKGQRPKEGGDEG